MKMDKSALRYSSYGPDLVGSGSVFCNKKKPGSDLYIQIQNSKSYD